MATTSTKSATRTAERSTWRQWAETWYWAYALLGVAIAGLAPILLPLTASRAGNAADIGLVMAAFSLGGLTAPLWGGLADRYRVHRWLLVGGLLTVAIGLVAFAFTPSPTVWLALALLISVGSAAAATVANLFVVEAHPSSEWDERIGWLQTFYGGGQVGGLLLAGLLSQVDLRMGLLVAAGLTALGILPGLFATHTPPVPISPKPVLLHPTRHGDWVAGSPQRLFHHLTWTALRQLRPALLSPFGIFLTIWLISFAGAAAVFSLYPVLMQQVFGIAPGLSSIAFALAAGLGLTLYAPAGHWSERLRPNRVLQIGLGLRLFAFLGLLSLGLVQFEGHWLALLGFALVVLAWSLLSVSGTALTANLAPIGEGAGMGIFNAVTALAGVVGAAAGGWVAKSWGYNAVSGFAAAGVALGFLVALWQHSVGQQRKN